MNTVKLFFALLSLFIGAALSGQIHNKSWIRFDYIDALNFTSHCKSDIVGRIESNILNGELTAYKEKELKNPLTVDEYYNLVAVRESFGTVISNPDDPYTIIDTVIMYIAGARYFSLASKNSVEVICGSGAKVYVGSEPFRKLLDNRLTAVTDYMESKGVNTFSDSVLSSFWKREIKQLGKQLYLQGVNGKVKAYRNASIKAVFTVEEIKDRVRISDWQQIQNPNNPGDIYDLIDTVIVTEFNPDSINTIRLLFEWQTEGFETEAKFIAIAPLFKPFAAGIQLPPTPIFWVADEEYLKKLNKIETAFWPYFYSFMLQNRSAGGEYDVFDENNLPAE